MPALSCPEIFVLFVKQPWLCLQCVRDGKMMKNAWKGPVTKLFFHLLLQNPKAPASLQNGVSPLWELLCVLKLIEGGTAAEILLPQELGAAQRE